MRKLTRPTLESASNTALGKLQALVGNADDAERLWKQKASSAPRKAAFADVRAKLGAMASGRERCMYCEDSQGTDIDHHKPKSAYPTHTFVWANYLLACSHCNSNEKRTQYPKDATGKPLLIDPSVDDPYAEIVFIWNTGKFKGLTPRAAMTIDVFGLNRRGALENGRRHAWTELVALVRAYKAATDKQERGRIQDAMRALSFQAVVQHFFRDALADRDSVPQDLRGFVQSTQSEWRWAL